MKNGGEKEKGPYSGPFSFGSLRFLGMFDF